MNKRSIIPAKRALIDRSNCVIIFFKKITILLVCFKRSIMCTLDGATILIVAVVSDWQVVVISANGSRIFRILASNVRSAQSFIGVVEMIGHFVALWDFLESLLHLLWVLSRCGTLFSSSRMASCRLWTKQESRGFVSFNPIDSSFISFAGSFIVHFDVETWLLRIARIKRGEGEGEGGVRVGLGWGWGEGGVRVKRRATNPVSSFSIIINLPNSNGSKI